MSNERLIDRVEIHTQLAGLEPSWKALQDGGFTTPYQTFDWTRHWVDTLGEALSVEPIFALCFSKDDQLQALFPFGLTKKKGIKSASFLGGKHANFNMGLFTKQAMTGLSKADIDHVLETIAAKHGVDLFRLENQPMQWSESLNPLAMLPSTRSPSSAWKTALLADGEAMIIGLMSSESRKKLRHKQKKLSDLGEISYVEALDEPQAHAMLQAFFNQKISRFKLLGMSNPFADDATVSFINRASLEGLANRQPAVSVFAMMAGERVLSVFGGSIHGGRFTGMFTSFDADPAVSRYSPGDLLLMNLVKMMCEKDLHTFDLGTGEATYKGDYCNTEEPLFDTLLPCTLKGRLIATGLSTAQVAKRWAKQSGPAMAVLKRLRKLRSG